MCGYDPNVRYIAKKRRLAAEAQARRQTNTDSPVTTEAKFVAEETPDEVKSLIVDESVVEAKQEPKVTPADYELRQVVHSESTKENVQIPPTTGKGKKRLAAVDDKKSIVKPKMKYRAESSDLKVRLLGDI